jgi:PAS domain S-box-containing protein
MTKKTESSSANTLVYENILNNMRDGVITVNLNGDVITFNQAAGTILELAPESIINQKLAKLIFSDSRNDEFTDVILKAIYDSNVTHKTVAKYYVGNKLKYLQMSTSFLFLKDKAAKKYGVIVVFSDVTETFAMERLKEIFGKYIDPRIASRILEETKESEASMNVGQRQTMTVSFCDMQNFTGISDPLSPAWLVEMMNIFFDKMARPIHDFHGIIDKFIGDEIMSFWGAPFTEEKNHALMACKAALGQINSLVSLNLEFANYFSGKIVLPQILVNIGIATGEVIVGNIGSKQARNYTVMGNTISAASRLVGINKLYGTHILLGEHTQEMVKDEYELREIDTIYIYLNQTKPIKIYELLGEKGKLSASMKKANENYAQGLALYREQRWPEAREYFVRSLMERPTDKAATVLINRSDYFSIIPPEKNWNGANPYINSAQF